MTRAFALLADVERRVAATALEEQRWSAGEIIWVLIDHLDKVDQFGSETDAPAPSLHRTRRLAELLDCAPDRGRTETEDLIGVECALAQYNAAVANAHTLGDERVVAALDLLRAEIAFISGPQQ